MLKKELRTGVISVILTSLFLVYVSPSANAAESTILGTTGRTPVAITIDSLGNIYTANSHVTENNVSKITPDGVSTILGGTGNSPTAITIDSSGNIYTANYLSNNVSKITPGGVSTILGTTGAGPNAITIDSAGNIYTANFDANNVSKITPDGVSTIHGTTGANPIAITIDSSGNIFTANFLSNNVSKITPGGVSTILGTTGANPIAITIDSSGNIYTANFNANTVSKITQAGVSTIPFATTGVNPRAITTDLSGNIYTANQGSFTNNVSKITPTSVSTIHGTTGAGPIAITIDSSGNIYTANSNSNNVTKITSAAVPSAPTLDSVVAGDRSVTISFTAGSNNGAAITDYEYSLNGGSYVSAGTITSPFTITSLSGRTAYSVTVKARNSVGLSSASSLLSATTTDTSLDLSEAAAEAARLAAIAEAARVAAAAEAARQAATAAAAKQQKELTEILSIIPSLGALALSLGETTKSLTLQKCVKKKQVRYIKKGAKCPKGFVKKK
jgi:DNA-binding beta-propeller fold protein YncE